MNESSAYSNYKDKVTVNELKTRDRWTRRVNVSGKPEHVMLYVAEKLQLPVTPHYEHMAWQILSMDYRHEGEVRPILEVRLYKSDYAGD